MAGSGSAGGDDFNADVGVVQFDDMQNNINSQRQALLNEGQQ